MIRLIVASLIAVVSLCSVQARADLIINPDLIGLTENGVVMDNGRYFVAGVDGIFEVKTASDNSPNCQFDPTAGLTLCTILPPQVQGRNCFYTGMTTDDVYLYAACSVFLPGDLGTLFPPIEAALVRILPGAGSTVADLTIRSFDEAVWYNGMVVLDDGSLLMTPSGLFQALPSITKLTFTNPSTLEFTLDDWLDSSLLYFFPNGLVVDNGYLYFVGGQNLNRVRILSNGSPGIPVIFYQALVDHVLDDIALYGDWIAVSEWSLFNVNSITLIHKTGLALPYRIDTGDAQLSSVAVDVGGLFSAGNFIGTSFNQGGIYHFELF